MANGFRYRGYTAGQLTRDLRAADAEARARGRGKLVEGAERIKNRSVEGAPIEEGDLEAGHRIVRRQIGPHKTSITIEVSAVAEDGVDYATIQHEAVEGTNWHPGPETAAKRAGSEIYVGPKFLERAAEELLPEIEQAILDAAFGALKD